jgi:Delta24-sterol reductase
MMFHRNAERHTRDVELIKRDFLKHAIDLTLTKPDHPSHLSRSSGYKEEGRQLNINHFCRVLQIDLVEKTIIVEPRITMKELVRVTLKYGLIPPIVPQFKEITVGGAVVGTAIESSSHLYGIFSDQCLAYEILLGDGSVINATREEHSDLFYGIVGSYGSLGVLLSIKLKLIPSTPWVKLKHKRFSGLDDFLRDMEESHYTKTPPDFIEGFVFSSDCFALVEGYYLKAEEACNLKNTLSLRFPWSKLFYLHVQDLEISKIKAEKISLRDYSFRHDRGAFWCYSPQLTWRQVFHEFFKDTLRLPSLARLLFPLGKQMQLIKKPNIILRWLCFWKNTSRNAYLSLHSRDDLTSPPRYLDQTILIGSREALPFITAVLEKTRITPLWIAPVVSTLEPQIFSPHFQPQQSLLCAVGIYGTPQVHKETTSLTKELEQLATSMKGRKMLYSTSHYSPNEFWNIYSKNAYQELRRIYHAHPWMNIDEKVLSK